MAKRKTKYRQVYVAYILDPHIDVGKDKAIKAVVAKHDGVFLGSGAGFGERDLDFDVPVPETQQVIVELKKIAKVRAWV